MTNKMNKEYFLKNDFLVLENFLEKETLQSACSIKKINKWYDPNKKFLDRQNNNSDKNQYESHENYSTNFVPTFNRFVADINELNFHLKEILDVFRSTVFLDNLKFVTGLDDLFFDESLRGGGLQKSKNGAFLRLHLDNNWNPKIECYPIINVILFLSDWCENYGGELELWNKNQKIKSIPPKLNTLVVRKNSPESYHGFPHPLKCPEEYSRLALVFFYYTKQIEPDQKRSSALWL